MKQTELPITNTDFDMKKYDTIIVGSPTWVSKPVPYIRTFFNKAEGVEGKNAGVFYTCAGKTEEAKTGDLLKEYLREIGLNTIDDFLSLRMKKEEILDGEQNIDGYVDTVLSR